MRDIICITQQADTSPFRQQLGYVHGCCGDALPAQTAGDVHQTADVAGNDDISPALFDAVQLVLQYAAGNVGVLNRKQPAKAATGLGALEFDDFDSLDPTQQAL